MNLRKMSSDLFDDDVRFECVIPLVGELDRNNNLEDIFEWGVLREELLGELDISEEIDDYEEFLQKVVDYNKFGMVAQITIREFENTNEYSAKGLASSKIYIIYAETYEELLDKALKKAQEQRRQEKLKYKREM